MAEGPGGKPVGKVSIKVVPDTSKFAKELKAQIERLEKQLELQIATSLNTKPAEADAAALRKRVEANDIVIGVRLDERGGVDQSVKRMRAASFRLGAPLEAVGRQFELIARSIDNAANSLIRMRQASVAVVGQTLMWAGRMVRLAVTIDNAKRAWSGIVGAVQAVTNAVKKIPSLASLSRDLASAAGSGLKLKAVNFGEFVRSLGRSKTYTDLLYNSMNRFAQSTDRVARGFKNLRNVNLRGLVSGAVNGFRRMGTSAVSAGRMVSRGLGRAIDGAIKGVGKGLSAAVSGIGSVFSKAGSAISSMTSALASMSTSALIGLAVIVLLAPALGLIVGLLAALPAMIALFGAGIGAIALGMDGIKSAASAAAPAFNALKTAVSSTFEKTLTPVFQRINDVLLPGITKGMQGVAEGVSGLMRSFFDVVTSAEGMKQINVILANTQTFFKNLEPFIANVTKTFLTLAEVGSERFGEMAKNLSAWADGFNKMIESAAQSGILQSAMSGLGQVMGALGDAFTRLFEAGLVAMSQMGGPLATLIGGFVDLFVALMPTLVTISNLVANVLGAAMSALVPVVKALTPSIEILGQVLGDLLIGAIQILEPLLTALAQILGAVLVSALKAIQPLIGPLVDFLVKLAEIIGTFLLQAFAALQPFLDALIKFAVDLMAALLPLLPPLLQLAQVALKALLDILTPLIPPLLDIAQAIMPLLMSVVQMLIPVIIELANMFSELVPKIADLVSVILGACIPILQSLLKVVQDVWPNIEGIIRGALTVIQGLIDFVMGAISGDWDRAWSGLGQVLKGAWDAIVETVKGAINLVISAVKEIPGAILGALGDLGGLLVNAGKSLIQGFINGIKSMASSAASAASGLLSSIRDFFPFSPAKRGPFSGRGYTTYSGRALAEDFAKGIKDKAPLAANAVEDMMSSADNAASSEWHGLVSSDGFGSLGDRISEALSGWSVQIDGNGMAKLVNNANRKRARR